MDTLHSVSNQFFGINPLLHSRLQIETGWDNFHVNHISDLTRYLQAALRPMGYLAQAEQSLQIRRLDGNERNPESDVSIYDPKRRSAQALNRSTGLALSVPELLELDEEDLASYRSVGIYEKLADGSRGDAVAWLELLSPSNKAGGRHADAYRNKRVALLQAGLVFIELDYLHLQAPTIAARVYPNQAGSSPYRILIIDPRPDWLSGEGRIYPIGIDEKLPILDIPLNAADILKFDFDAPYQQTYKALFFGDEVDYARLPLAWESYRPDDQAKILSRLLAIDEKQDVLERAVEAVDVLNLSEALERWHSRVNK